MVCRLGLRLRGDYSAPLDPYCFRGWVSRKGRKRKGGEKGKGREKGGKREGQEGREGGEKGEKVREMQGWWPSISEPCRRPCARYCRDTIQVRWEMFTSRNGTFLSGKPKIYAEVCQNRPRFVKDMTKTF